MRRHEEIPETEFARYSLAALRQVLDQPGVRLVRQVWARQDLREDATDVVLDDRIWSEPGDEPYLAVVGEPR